MMATLDILSGLGVKGPACIRLTVNGQRWLLDCGEGPDENAPFHPDWLEGIDAVLITHDHIDHIGGAGHVVARNLPIYCTPQTAKSLPTGASPIFLPDQGSINLGGVRLTTGRNGHAVGGVWFHFDIGEGLFYSGDWSEESSWFAFDPPPPAATALLDCSYALDDITQQERIAAFDQQIDQCAGQVLLPLPPSGRAGEVAIHLIERFGAQSIMLDDACQAAVAQALATGSLGDKADLIKPVLEKTGSGTERFLICDKPNADGGEAQRIAHQWRQEKRLDKDAHILFTGYLNLEARQMVAQGEAHFRRWNVHPSLSDQQKMMSRLAAEQVVPLFCEDPSVYRTLTDHTATFILDRSLTL